MIDIIPLFESYNNNCLVIVDVQEPFKKWWIKNGKPNLVEDINKYCQEFAHVYQIWDCHDEAQPSYTFPNQVLTLKKYYGKILNDTDIEQYFEGEDLEKVRNMFRTKIFNKELFKTKDDTYSYILYVGGSHKWFFASKELVDTLQSLEGNITVIGGAERECLEDVEVLLNLLGKHSTTNYNYTYHA